MKIKVINIDNKPGKEIELSDFVFGIEPRSDIMARVVRWQLAKRRLGNHSVKTRADIKMTTAKMYKQKGTGNARHGSAAVSQFRGGGSAHGPVVHSHSHSLNKKVRLLGLRSALSAKARLGKLFILENVKCDGKSASLKKKLDAMGFKNLLVITGDSVDLNFQRAANNIIHVDLLSHAGLNVYDIVRKENLIITDDAVKLLEGRFV
ncbi:50S ribosomal protein L4 [Alphaproteobacteria bacterium]|nr:50S ribosomal protein L4 [Alphaproteobacteria bacterium]MDB9872395.1 50S ribosomal protein L4 [Alphaproteobacteria bacterium]